MADTFSLTTAAPPSAPVLQRTLHSLQILRLKPTHSAH